MLNQQGKVFTVSSSRGKFAVHRALGIWQEVALNREWVNVFIYKSLVCKHICTEAKTAVPLLELLLQKMGIVLIH